VIFPAWMKYVYKHNVDRFLQFASRVFDIDKNYDEPERTALEGIYRLKQFFNRIGMPTSLKELDVPDDRLEEMASKCKRPTDGKLGNFVRLSKEDILEIYKIANQ
ncbi:MAG: iron-containing alcohol dehydrogenase, partial [Halanaerobiales bacterium]